MANSYGTSEGYTVQMAGPFGSVQSPGKISTITLRPEEWKNAESPFFQVVAIEGISESSMVEIQASKEQSVKLCADGTAICIENDGGVATAYAIGTKPTEELVLQVILTEVLIA